MSKKNYDKHIQDLLEFIKTKDYVYSKDIPNIDLYMDQVTTFMDDHLGLFKRSDEDKVLTKTMINNYSKCGLLPTSDKKKYSSDHMILLLFIYYFKHILSIPDIQSLLEPIQAIVLKEKSPVSMDEFLDRIMDIQKKYFDTLANQVNYTVEVSKGLFPEFNEADQELLSIFTTSYLLSIQATAQKHMVTQLIDNYVKKQEPKASATKKGRT